MTALLFLCLLALSLGSLLCLPLISLREIGRGFFTLWGCITGGLGGLALALHGAGASGLTLGAAAGGRITLFLAVCLGLLLPFWLLLRFEAHRLATLALALSALSGALVLREIAMTIPAALAGDGPAWAEFAALRVTSLLLSAIAVGAVTVAMVLGHWYLVQPKLALAPLRRLCDVFLGILILRLAVSAWGFASSLRGGFRFWGGADPVPWEVIILSQRLLFGFGGSLILAVMIRKTVALRATMSATGLLYIAILFVWVGEFLSIYLGRLTAGGLVV